MVKKVLLSKIFSFQNCLQSPTFLFKRDIAKKTKSRVVYLEFSQTIFSVLLIFFRYLCFPILFYVIIGIMQNKFLYMLLVFRFSKMILIYQTTWQLCELSRIFSELQICKLACQAMLSLSLSLSLYIPAYVFVYIIFLSLSLSLYIYTYQ